MSQEARGGIEQYVINANPVGLPQPSRTGSHPV
jgi:hypothetical protein